MPKTRQKCNQKPSSHVNCFSLSWCPVFMMKQFGSIAMLAQARLDCRLGPRHYPIAICLSWLNCNFGSSQSTLSILMITQAGSIAILAQVRIPYQVWWLLKLAQLQFWLKSEYLIDFWWLLKLAQLQFWLKSGPRMVCVCVCLCVCVCVYVFLCVPKTSQKPAAGSSKNMHFEIFPLLAQRLNGGGHPPR